MNNSIAYDKEISVEDIYVAYSGKKDACMCGCSGNYRVNPEHVDYAEKDRGYGYSEEEINLRSVKMIINKIKKFGPRRDPNSDNYVFAETETRIYVAYFVKKEA